MWLGNFVGKEGLVAIDLFIQLIVLRKVEIKQ
jgi:hypothetical protein